MFFASNIEPIVTIRGGQTSAGFYMSIVAIEIALGPGITALVDAQQVCPNLLLRV